MDIRFADQIVLITGASRGIGAATARLFADSGAKVALHYNTGLKQAEAVKSGLPGSGHLMVQANLTQPAEIQELVNRVIAFFGRIDILVNNAGVYEEHEMASMEPRSFLAYWERTLSVNLSGPVFLAFLVAREMIRGGGGRIINVTSRGAFRGEPCAWGYGAAKAGLNAAGQSMAKALAPHHITVFTLAPGFVDTEMSQPALAGSRRKEIESQSPLNRVARPEEIAGAILLLAAPGNEFMTGCILDMNGASYLR